jgi:hypothetical protein
MVHEHACARLSDAPQCYSLEDNASNRAGSLESRPVSKLEASASPSGLAPTA